MTNSLCYLGVLCVSVVSVSEATADHRWVGDVFRSFYANKAIRIFCIGI
jgi:hypothetical protein